MVAGDLDNAGGECLWRLAKSGEIDIIESRGNTREVFRRNAVGFLSFVFCLLSFVLFFFSLLSLSSFSISFRPIS